MKSCLDSVNGVLCQQLCSVLKSSLCWLHVSTEGPVSLEMITAADSTHARTIQWHHLTLKMLDDGAVRNILGFENL